MRVAAQEVSSVSSAAVSASFRDGPYLLWTIEPWTASFSLANGGGSPAYIAALVCRKVRNHQWRGTQENVQTFPSSVIIYLASLPRRTLAGMSSLQ